MNMYKMYDVLILMVHKITSHKIIVVLKWALKFDMVYRNVRVHAS